MRSKRKVISIIAKLEKTLGDLGKGVEALEKEIVKKEVKVIKLQEDIEVLEDERSRAFNIMQHIETVMGG
jgi:predicted  nucleic acid-binding Zn-ribbon protein